MKSRFFPALFALPATAGICAAYLKAMHISHSEAGAFEAIVGEAASVGFSAVCIIAVLMALVAAFILKNGVAFRSGKTEAAAKAALSVCAVLILAYAGTLLISLRNGFEAITLILGLLSIYCAVSFFVMAKHSLAVCDSVAYCVCSAVPVFWACFLIVISFREKISNPIISEYVTLIFAYISILLFAYSLAAKILGKKKTGVMVFACFSGLFFILVELLTPLFLIGKVNLLSAYSAKELLVQVAFLLMMPSVTIHILKK
ncbi:MAG: hypothetical protein IKU65_02165 [Oscillospiraceae bacterium]|nr:hypothetical protein [Oscillospiraceae bacterium]